ncbi:MAG: glycosyl hydrolase [Ignavibacteriae bacterium]|nr:glycosyl hydrolase [Ignavibacteriota bacterium]
MFFVRMFLTLAVCLPVLSYAQKQKSDEGKEKDPMSSATFEGLKFRALGPALTSGRISDLAVNPNNTSEWYIAVASGGVWKTTNAGTTFEPIFDGEGSYSIGCVTIDPNNPFVVWVGSGENNSQRSVAYGDGVYRSEDGGKSWKNMGLKKSEHIAKIIVDPRDSRVVYVAAQGPLWGPGGDRGVFKTTDGGATWDSVLYISKHTGVTDMVMDPRNPDVLYAASYQRRRHVFTLIDGGPESAIYKSVDAGKTWNKLANGLPTGDVGRIGLAISPVNPDVLFALIELPNRKGGFYRSINRGASWEKRSDYANGSAQYYSEIFCDPKDVERAYSMDVYLKVTNDGGKTFENLGEKNKHVDNHAIWIDPDNTNHYLVGCDGGLYESFDRAATWNYKPNLPVIQFYRVTIDNSQPFYYVYGGTQDNFSMGGPSQTVSASGISNSDWFVTTSGDGFFSAVDPDNPNIVYSESQYGVLVRYDRKTGEQIGIQPKEGKGEPALRWNWDSPLIISPHKSSRLYFAANILFRSEDRGDSWTPISGDLTRQIDRNKLQVMDKIWSIDAVAKNASTSLYGNIVSLSESPKKEGVLYVGTDDGLIQMTENGGGAWRKIEKFPGVPEMTYVSCITASQHDASTVYAAFDNHKNADFNPYILKSVDGGKSWSSIKGNLPANGVVYSIAEDHVNPKLLFAGTEFGVFFTIDGGSKWIQLKGGLPVIAVKDMAIHKSENDLVLATFGRGFYILDDYSPLRTLSASDLEKEAVLFPTPEALMYIQSRPLGLRGNGFMGESYYAASNPAFGATITYYLKDSYKTKKKMRQEEEKEIIKKGDAPKIPSWDELRAEDTEEEPGLVITIADASGNVVRRLNASNTKGVNRVTWDLRYAATTPTTTAPPSDDAFDEGEMGRLAMPGKYTVSLAKRVGRVVTPLGEPQTFTATVLGAASLPQPERRVLAEFQSRAADLHRAVTGATRVASDIKSHIGLLKKSIQDTPGASTKLRDDLNAIEEKNRKILVALNGDNTLRSRNEGTPPSINERLETIIYDQWLSTSTPTQTHIANYEIAGDEFTPVLAQLKSLVETDLKNLEAAMEAAGAPWTPGRVPVWERK